MSTVPTPATAHPSWCDTTVCEVSLGGAHRSPATRVNLRRGQTPRMLLMLAKAETGPVLIRMVTLGDAVVHEVTLSLDEAHLTAAALLKLITLAAPPADEPESGPLGTRH